jgi:uncharacterized protein (TIGR00369 family)
MLDYTMGPLIVAVTDGRLYGTTIDLHVHFLRPVRPGPITTKAKLTQLGKTIAYAEAQLFDAKGQLAARATCSSLLIEGVFPKAG